MAKFKMLCSFSLARAWLFFPKQLNRRRQLGWGWVGGLKFYLSLGFCFLLYNGAGVRISSLLGGLDCHVFPVL
jgi:hypothetical protein